MDSSISSWSRPAEPCIIGFERAHVNYKLPDMRHPCWLQLLALLLPVAAGYSVPLAGYLFKKRSDGKHRLTIDFSTSLEDVYVQDLLVKVWRGRQRNRALSSLCPDLLLLLVTFCVPLALFLPCYLHVFHECLTS